MDVDAQGLQGCGGVSIPTPVNEPMHDVHAETNVGQAHDPHSMQEQVVACFPGPSCVGEALIVKAFTCKHDWDKVTP